MFPTQISYSENEGVTMNAQAAFSEWFGMPGYHAKHLERLRQAKGAPVQLHPKPSVAKVIACNLRKGVDPEAIEGAGRGAYYITDIGLAECETAIRECAA